MPLKYGCAGLALTLDVSQLRKKHTSELPCLLVVNLANDRRGDGGRAHDLSAEGKSHQKRQDDLDDEASAWIFNGTF